MWLWIEVKERCLEVQDKIGEVFRNYFGADSGGSIDYKKPKIQEGVGLNRGI